MLSFKLQAFKKYFKNIEKHAVSTFILFTFINETVSSGFLMHILHPHYKKYFISFVVLVFFIFFSLEKYLKYLKDFGTQLLCGHVRGVIPSCS